MCVCVYVAAAEARGECFTNDVFLYSLHMANTNYVSVCLSVRSAEKHA